MNRRHEPWEMDSINDEISRLQGKSNIVPPKKEETPEPRVGLRAEYGDFMKKTLNGGDEYFTSLDIQKGLGAKKGRVDATIRFLLENGHIGINDFRTVSSCGMGPPKKREYHCCVVLKIFAAMNIKGLKRTKNV